MENAEVGLRQIEVMALELEDPVVLAATSSVRDVASSYAICKDNFLRPRTARPSSGTSI